MTSYQGNILIKNPATPTGPAQNGSAPGIWKLNEALAFKRQGIWPTQGVLASDTYFTYVSLLLSTTALGSANNNLFVDSSGAFNPLSRTGNTTQGSATPYGTRWSNYLGGGSSAFSNAGNGVMTGNFTVEFWMYLEDYSTTRGIYTAGNETSQRVGFFVTTSGRLAWDLYGGGTTTIGSNNSVPTKAWTHVALVKNSSTLTGYINGTAVGSASMNYTFGNSNGFNALGAWLGYASNFRVVNGTAVYTANFTPPTSPLTAISGTFLLICQNNRFVDNSTNNFNMTRAGTISVTNFSPFAPASPGIVYNQSDITNWSGYFDGNTDWLSLDDSAAWDFGTGDFTIECWVYPQSSANDQAYISNYQNSGSGWLLGTDSSGTRFSWGDTSIFSNATRPTLNQWSHLAVSRSGTSLRVFLNGTQLGSTVTNSTSLTNNAGIRIGRLADGGLAIWYFTGYLSNLRVVKGTAVYTANFTPPTTNLTAISGTSLLTLQNAAFTDNSTNNFVVTINGNTTVTGNSPFNTVGYWSLAGTSTQGATIPQTTATDLGSGSFTVECWVNTLSYDASFVTKRRTDTALTGSWMLAVNPSGFFTFQGVGWASSYQATTNAIPVGAWTHLAVSRSGTNLSMFVNGVRVYNVTDSYDYTCSTYTIIKLAGNSGGNYPSGGALFGGHNGLISNFRIVQGTAVYNPASSTITVPTSPLTAISGTSLLTCQNGTMKDNSTNNNTSILLYGGASIQSFDPFYTATIASNGGSMYFDGSGDYLSVPYNSALNILSGNFTVETWVYPTGTSGLRTFVGQWQQSAGLGGFIFGSNGANFAFYFAPFNDTNPILTASTAFTPGSWYHVAVVRSGSSFTMYVNGVSAATATSSSTLAAVNVPIAMGSYYSSGGTLPASGATDFAGYLSGTRITKSVVYSAAFTPPTAPASVTPDTTLLVNGMNAGAYDATAINDMETVGNAQVSTAVSKFGGSSVYFDASGDYLVVPSTPDLTLGSGDFTIEFWTYLNTVIDRCFYDQRTATNQVVPTIYTSGSNQISYYVSGANRITGAALNTGQWYHIALTRSGSSTKMFVDGTQTGSTYTDTNNYIQSRLVVGTYGDVLNSGFINGYIDDLRVTKGVARYTTTFTPPTQAFPTY